MPPNPRLRAQRAISELSVLSTAPPPSDGAWSPSSPAATPVISAESAAGSLAAPEAANNLKAAERPEKHTAAEGSGHSAAEAADVEPAAAAAAGAALSNGASLKTSPVPFRGRVSPERGNKNNLQVAPVSSDASVGLVPFSSTGRCVEVKTQPLPAKWRSRSRLSLYPPYHRRA